jgi:predicted RNA-binding protein with PIN domain
VRGQTYVVDGYNVLHAFFPRMGADELAERRRWLADVLAGFAALRAAKVVLVFDAHGKPAPVSEMLPGTSVEVCFAGGRFSADTLIARRVAERPADAAIVVVSADQEVQRTATRAGVTRMTPRELADELGFAGDADAAHDKKLANSEKNSRMPSTLEDKVDVETWTKLERLRRQDAPGQGDGSSS